MDVVADGVIRVYRAPAGAEAQPETPSPAIIAAAPTGNAAGGDAGSLSVELDPDTGLLTVRDVTGDVLLRELSAEPEDGDGGPRLAFSMRRDEEFYGLGQKVRGAGDTSLSWRGRRRQFGPFGNAREKSCPGVAGQGDGNTTIPLLLSSAGYGFFFDNHYRHEWDFTSDRAWTVAAARGELRYYVIHGPDPAAILERYTRLTGRPPLPPRWALGLLQSKFGYRNWDEVERDAERYRTAGIPADAIILDLYWFGGVPHFGGARRIGALEWDHAAFPDARRRIAALRARGFKVILIEEPYVDDALPAHREAARERHLAWQERTDAPVTLEKWWGRGGIVDMTSPAARRWWWGRHRALLDDGVGGWWCDLGEPDTFDPTSRYAGGAHEDVHNLYALEWARCLAEGYAADRPAERPFILTRSGYAGIQRHGAALWSNDVMTDFAWLAPQVATGLNLGLSGVPYWGSDVGGFIGPVASDELYVRWFQFGAFSPIFRPHGQERPTAPFEFSPQVERICREYARLRYRLLPYIYTAAREAHDTGMPLMRALPAAFPDDPVVCDLGAEYLFGPSLLVAPVLHTGTERNVYLPAGEWVDFWSHQVYTGPTWLRRYPAPLDIVPLFVRAGAILPLGPEVAWADERPLDALTLRVYPGRALGAYTLYEDDGRTNAYRRGACARTAVSFAPHPCGFMIEVAAAEGTFDGMVRTRELVVEVVVDAAPTRVTWNGAETAKWTYEPARRLLTVCLGRVCVAERQRVGVAMV